MRHNNDELEKGKMRGWAAEELKKANLGDARLNQRLVKIVENLAAQPETTVPQACGSWAESKATYRFWQNKNVEAEQIIEAHLQTVIDRAKTQPVILAIQDTTDLSFAHHRSKTTAKGFGLLNSQEYLLGLKVHSVFGVTAWGVPLGLLHQQVWAREPSEKGKTKQRRKRPILDKESKRWLTSLVATELGLPQQIGVVTIADREADIYDLLALERTPNSHLLIRATHNRRVDHESYYLHQAVSESPIVGQLQARTTSQGKSSFSSSESNCSPLYSNFVATTQSSPTATTQADCTQCHSS
jgi:hypothetical protein